MSIEKDDSVLSVKSIAEQDRGGDQSWQGPNKVHLISCTIPDQSLCARGQLHCHWTLLSRSDSAHLNGVSKFFA
jgi:hypothetical protein